MDSINKKYEISRKNAFIFMKNGQITAYVNALIEMRRYKHLMLMICAN
jgi:hypothetical protein